MSASAFTPNIGKDVQRMHVEHREAAGVNSGGVTSGAWFTRPLNTVKINDIPGASLSGDVVTLPAGTYRVRGTGCGYYMYGYKIRLRKTNGTAVTLASSTSEHSPGVGTDQSSTRANIEDSFVLTETSTIELQMRTQVNRSGDGMGTSQNYGEDEIYSTVVFEREIPAINDVGEFVRGPMSHWREEQASGTQGGTGSALAWTPRTLNTDVQVGIVGSSRSGNQFTLPAGDYEIEFEAPFHGVNHNRLRIQNITDGVTVALSGLEEYNANGSVRHTLANQGGPEKFSISAPKTFELQYYFATSNGVVDLGQAYASMSSTEYFAQVRVWKLVRAGVQETDPSTKPFLHVREEQASASGQSAGTASTWNVRVLNTVVTNEISGASLSSNTVTLPAGTYLARAIGPARNVQAHVIRLQDTTNAVTLARGTNESSNNADFTDTSSHLEERFTLTAAANVQLQHWIDSTATTMGTSINGSFTEVYGQLWITKLD